MAAENRRWRTGLAAVCAGVFVWSGIAKILGPREFLDNIRGFHMMPYPAAYLLTFIVPWLEVTAGAGLSVPAVARESRALLTLLLAGFTAAVAFAWARGLEVSCGCFGGVAESTDYRWWIARNLALGLAVMLSRPFTQRS